MNAATVHVTRVSPRCETDAVTILLPDTNPMAVNRTSRIDATQIDEFGRLHFQPSFQLMKTQRAVDRWPKSDHEICHVSGWPLGSRISSLSYLPDALNAPDLLSAAVAHRFVFCWKISRTIIARWPDRRTGRPLASDRSVIRERVFAQIRPARSIDSLFGLWASSKPPSCKHSLVNDIRVSMNGRADFLSTPTCQKEEAGKWRATHRSLLHQVAGVE